MEIKKITITDFRVLKDIQLELSSGLNLITGANGMGKTSILEAVYVLGRGRSFRNRSAGHFIREDCKQTLVSAQLENSSNQFIQLGLERGKKHIRVRKNAADLKRRSELIRTLPLIIITPQSHQLIEGSPEIRRKFIDHSMFHVEHSYHSLLSLYTRILKQRNAALKHGQQKVALSFNQALIDAGNKLTDTRADYFKSVKTYLSLVLGELNATFEIDIKYKTGWPEGISFSDALDKKLEQDFKYQTTSVGPHRADLSFLVDETLAETRLSRGQQKLLIYALNIALVKFNQTLGVENPILLVDDIGAEFDDKNANLLIALLQTLNIQVVATAIQSYDLPETASNRMFHVEHGEIKRI